MECVFDENELEYMSCERPMCNHTECDKHEEYLTPEEEFERDFFNIVQKGE